MPVRMKDIAMDLGVSVVTVSKVVRNHSDISEETRERVLRRMKELNYRPNLAARALVTGRTFSMGLIVPDLTHPFFAQVAKGLSGALRKAGYGLILSSSEDDPELEQQEIDQLLARRVDALLIASTQWTVESFRRIEEQRTPYVLIDRQFMGLAAHFVGVNDEQAGYLATAHLIDQGCERIAHIRGPEVSTAVGRAEGFRRALAEKGRTALPEHVIPIGASGDDRGESGGREAMRKLLETDPRPDAVFCYNDPVALGAMRSVLEAGLRIPQDIAVVGCGNLNYADLLRVPLTSVDQGVLSIGEQAGNLALSLIGAKGPIRPKSHITQPSLVVRASSLRRQD
jgi:LacI family transcriptional regulator